MDPKRWEKLEALVEQVLAMPAGKRERFLSEACGLDTELHSEIQSLLRNSDKALRFTRNFSENVMLPTYFELGAQQEQAESFGQPSLIDKVITHYHVVERIGSGGMGVVYKARDLRLDRFVAIKLLPPHLTSDPNAKQRFISEAKAVSALDHPNICTIHEISETDSDRLFMVMTWYQGETLAAKIKKGALSPRCALHYALQIADGLACAHKAGFTHRDVKPANIMITDNQVVKILDFGIARNRQHDLTREGTAIGSLPYMSPEQVHGEKVDCRSDIWALGVILYEMLTGKRPFEGKTDASVLNAILHREVAPLTNGRKKIPAPLEDIVRNCLVKDPGQRYQYTVNVLVDLKKVDNEVASDIKTLISGQSTFPELHTTKSPASVQAGGNFRQSVMYTIPILFALSVVFLLLRPHPTPVFEAQRSIAVMPFENLSPDPDDAYFTDGMHEDIIIQLSQIGNIRPIARSSVLRYSSENRDLTQIAEELNVVSVLEGNVRRSGNHIRVSVQLVDPRSHEILWAESYERNDLTALFDIQRSIAVEITAALQASLTPDEQNRLEERPTEVAEAYEFYLRAREYFFRTEYLEENYRRTETLLKRAIEFDPEFVQAYALLSRTYSMRSRIVGYDISPQILEESKKNAEIAHQLNPESAEAHLAMGYYYYFGHQDHNQALEHLTTARHTQPNNAEIITAIGYVQRWFGNIDESKKIFTEALSLDPLNPDLRFDIAMTYTALRNYEAANTEFETALSLSPDFHIAGYYHHLNTYIWKGDTELASAFIRNHEHFKDEHPSLYLMLQFMIRDFEGMIRTVNEVSDQVHRIYLHMFPPAYFLGLAYDYQDEPEKAKQSFESALSKMQELPAFWHNDPGYRMGLGRIYAVLGMEEQAIAEVKRVDDLLSPAQNHVFVRNKWFDEYLLFIYAQLGKTVESVDLIRRLFEIESGYISVPRLKTDPVWDPIRDTQEFQELIEEFI